MDSITQWLQDWLDACQYANECVPDVPLRSLEPYSALGSITAACFILWWWNERRKNGQEPPKSQAPVRAP